MKSVLGHTSPRQPRRRLLLESLESRMVMAGPVQVVLMIGQSNMGGYPSNTDLRSPLDTPQSDVWIWQDDLGQNVGWTSLRGGFGGDGSNFSSGGNGTQFGPEVSLGRALGDSNPGSQFALIKHVAGVTMQDGWNPDRGGGAGPGQTWADFVAKTHKALDELSASQMSYEIAGLLVFQGSRDAVNETGVEAANYEQNFAHFISGVRTEFGAPQLPVVIAKLPETSVVGSTGGSGYGNTLLVRNGQYAVDAADPLMTMIDVDDFSRIEDGAHYDAEGEIGLGRRFADAFLGQPFEGSARAGSDGFESGGFASGFEQWAAGAWTVSGDAVVTTANAPFDGTHHVVLRNSTGDLVRAVDATGLTNVKLRFRSKLESFESGDKAWVQVSANGTNWATVREFVDGEDDGVYRYHEIDIPDIGNTIYVRFNAEMNQSTDYWYIDNVIIEGTTRGKPSAEVPNKFYVADDAATNRTYEYAAGGGIIEDYNLSPGSSAPRGAASTAAGTTVWVADANRNVYVYDNKGELQGLWSAGSLSTNAAVEGIATNGTDIWLVDGSADRVYRFAGAASRLSGSQNAVSSFNLNKSNSNPKDLVTDGTSIWVVDDGSTDKVFKYNVSGSLLGSWTITGAGASPTGITLDPSSPSHLWIVDSGTDRVYQFDAAIGRISGSQSPSTSFALAAGNTNPQGIADPPTGSGKSVAFDAALLSYLNDSESLPTARRRR